MERRQQNRAEFILHAFTMCVFFVFLAAYMGNIKTSSNIPIDPSSIVAETSFEYDALPVAPPVVPDFDENKVVSVNSEFIGVNSQLLTILETNRNIQVEFLQLGISFQKIQPSLALIAFVKKDFSPRGEKYPFIS